MGEKQLRGVGETLAQHTATMEQVAEEFARNGWSVEVMPSRSRLTLTVGTTPVVIRDERRQDGRRLCVEYEERGGPAGPFRVGASTMWIHLLPTGAAAFPGWWMRREVEWRREFRSTRDGRYGDSGSRSILVPVLSCLMRPEEPFHMAYGDPVNAAVPAFEATVSFLSEPNGGPR
jgi:hypothetical protein